MNSYRFTYRNICYFLFFECSLIHWGSDLLCVASICVVRLPGFPPALPRGCRWGALTTWQLFLMAWSDLEIILSLETIFICFKQLGLGTCSLLTYWLFQFVVLSMGPVWAFSLYFLYLRLSPLIHFRWRQDKWSSYTGILSCWMSFVSEICWFSQTHSCWELENSAR